MLSESSVNNVLSTINGQEVAIIEIDNAHNHPTFVGHVLGKPKEYLLYNEDGKLISIISQGKSLFNRKHSIQHHDLDLSL
jgi:fructose-specific component phosphotransferase system IIB-like protein